MSENKLIKKDILKYLKQHKQKEFVRFITCGSVDDGKSTLIGRLLYETKMIFKDQLMSLKAEAKYKRTDEVIDFSLLVDGLQAEREQRITIDVAYRYFSTDKRKFIIADTPGHEQYTRNMATGASNADIAVILIDARNGLLTQTRRHSFIVTLLGIRHIIIAINKMDIVNYSKNVYDKIVHDYKKMFESLKFSLPYKNFKADLYFIPISALKGENVVKKTQNIKWYKGKPLIELLDTVTLKSNIQNSTFFRFPVQYINRPHLNFRGYCGTIASGNIKTGDKIIIYPAKVKTKIKSIISPDYNETPTSNIRNSTLEVAFAPMSVTILTEDEVDISRGDLIVRLDEKQPKFNDSFEAFVVWMDKGHLKNQEYILKIYTKKTHVIISRILFKKDVNTWKKIEAKSLELNDIARVQIDVTEKISFDLYEENRNTGAFILINKITNFTSAVGMIVGEATMRNHKRIYTQSEIALNKFIREHFPEWDCKAIEQIVLK